MREIKFRCWDKENKEMLEVQELDYADSYDGQPMVRTTMYNDYFDTEDMILMQYTGLKDKNGKEIYEGDIVHIPDDYEEYGFASGENYSIDFKDGRFRLKPKYKPNATGYDLEFTEELEVIGNIYENPKLLEDK